MGHLRLEDFERTVLTMVYTAQRLANATTGQQRDLWAESFVSLYRAIKLDLTAENDLTAKWYSQCWGLILYWYISLPLFPDLYWRRNFSHFLLFIIGTMFQHDFLGNPWVLSYHMDSKCKFLRYTLILLLFFICIGTIHFFDLFQTFLRFITSVTLNQLGNAEKSVCLHSF